MHLYGKRVDAHIVLGTHFPTIFAMATARLAGRSLLLGLKSYSLLGRVATVGARGGSLPSHRLDECRNTTAGSGAHVTRRSNLCTTTNAGLPASLLYEETKFNSATVDVSKITVEDTADFALKLFATIEEVRKRHKAAIWIKIPIDYCHYISIAAHYGFVLHHTKPRVVMMNMWLPQDVPNKIPQYGTHHLGVAGCVLNDEREVLLVKDKHEGSVWKFPGGLADAGEGIAEAAAREVFEETGVEAEFRSVLTMRHQHNLQFGNSDMYFICRLAPKASGAQNITRCAHEIADACWMPLEQFRRETKHSMLAVVAEMLERPEETELGRSQHESVVPGRNPFWLYHRSLR